MAKSVSEMTTPEAQKALDDAVAASLDWKPGHEQRPFSAYETDLRAFLAKAGFDGTRIIKLRRVFIGPVQGVEIHVIGPNGQVLTPS